MEFDSTKVEKYKKMFVSKQEFDAAISDIRQELRKEFNYEVEKMRMEFKTAINNLNNKKLDNDWLQNGFGIKYSLYQGAADGYGGGTAETRIYNPKTRIDKQIS